MAFSARQNIEFFHLVFLRALVAKGEEKSLIALKGGCNLRFYFGSIRYSEDMDFDVSVIAKGTLKNRIDRLLKSPIILSPLRAKGLELVDISTPKQTDTTQRWKIGLQVQGFAFPLRTKVEFSRRDAIEGAVFEGIEREVARAYDLTSSLATHYTTHAAITQKIHALAARSEPQARDVFDLNVLFARADARGFELALGQKRHLAPALEHAMAISFDEYVSKVVAYLDPNHAPLYTGRSAWNAMQEAVTQQLEALQ